MSDAAKEIACLIEHIPENWSMRGSNAYHGITNGPVIVAGYGNTRLLSIISVFVNEKELDLSYWDKWVLEVTLKKWFKKRSLNYYLKTN